MQDQDPLKALDSIIDLSVTFAMSWAGTEQHYHHLLQQSHRMQDLHSIASTCASMSLNLSCCGALHEASEHAAQQVQKLQMPLVDGF